LEHIITTAPARKRNPRLARIISLVPGLGQLYYGAPRRAAQYLAGVVIPMALAVLLYEWSLFDLARMEISGLLKSFAFLGSELVVLTLVVTFISFWIAASWDARQGTIAFNEGRAYHPKWWYVKVKEFLFDDPEEEAE
jgi:TM2 domain-containing membrane protein YozV